MNNYNIPTKESIKSLEGLFGKLQEEFEDGTFQFLSENSEGEDLGRIVTQLRGGRAKIANAFGAIRQNLKAAYNSDDPEYILSAYKAAEALKDVTMTWLQNLSKENENSQSLVRSMGESHTARRKITEEHKKVLETTAQLQAANRLLYDQARTDDLTGIGNYKKFREVLAEEVREVNAYKGQGLELSLLIMDFVGFKPVNDSIGHPGGDILLRLFADRASDSSLQRKTDTFCRNGGDEFAYILPVTGEQGALELARKIWRATNSMPFQVYDHADPVNIGISIGVAQHIPGESAEDLYQRADACLYAVKHRLIDNSKNAIVAQSELSSFVRANQDLKEYFVSVLGLKQYERLCSLNSGERQKV